MKTIYEVLSKAHKGDTITDGLRSWTVVDTEKTGDCIVAVPVMPFGPKKSRLKPFELWGDDLSKMSYIKNLSLIRKD